MAVASVTDRRQTSERLFGKDPAPAAAPSNVEAEQALLGSILFDNAAFERAADLVKAHDFYEPFHARLYAAMAEHIARGQLAEPIVIMERFRLDPAFEELGGLRYLADLVDRAPPAANAAGLARVIRDLSQRRELIRLGGDLATEAAAGDGSAVPLIEKTEAALYGLAERGEAARGDKTFAQAVTGALEAAGAAYSRDGGLSGLSTGLIDLDRLLGGLHPTDLLILAARPSMGKTGMAANIAFDVARKYAWERGEDGRPRTIAGGVVQFFSLEMSAEQLALRILAQRAAVPGDRIRRGDIDSFEYARIRDAALEVQDAPLFIDDTGALSIAQIAARARRRKRLSGLDLIVVDYLQLATANEYRGQGNRVAEVSEITAGLKAVAKDLEVPVLALSQLSRKVEDREDKRPQLADLRESGSIEQDADAVVFLYREAYYKARSEPREGTQQHLDWQDDLEKIRHVAEAIVAKQRHGPIGTVRLHFNEDLISFSNLAREARFSELPAYAEASKPKPVFARDPSGRD